MNSREDIHNLATVISKGIREYVKNLHTALPGTIESFNNSTQLASIKIGVQRVLSSGDVIDYPLLINVPVVFPQGGGFSITFPVEKGDDCLVIFAERSIDAWTEFGSGRRPQVRRYHDLSDGIALVGMNTKANRIQNFNSSKLEIRNKSGSVKIQLGDDVVIHGDIEIKDSMVVRGDLDVLGELGVGDDLDVEGELNVDGDINTNGIYRKGGVPV